MEKQGEIILYQIENSDIYINVVFRDESFWMTQKAMAELFEVNSQAITKHIGNILEDGELEREATCSKMEQVQQEGNRQVRCNKKCSDNLLCD